MLGQIYDQIDKWLFEGKLQLPRVTETPMEDIGAAHQLLQSGKSVGKIVIIARDDEKK
jgi:NADPH-dependent curcumin reductase CurA